jgi:putative addiction module killer protein
MFEVIRTATFDRWLSALKDGRAQARIAQRIDRLSHGNAGDVKPVGSAVSELRIDYGPGYRVYFSRRGSLVILLLCGGDKSTQAKDIKRAMAMAKELKV